MNLKTEKNPTHRTNPAGTGLISAGRVKAGLAAITFGLCAATAASAAERVVLVLDASGSMAGRINGVQKIDIARNAVDNLLRTMKPGTELGLMAYGHRRKNDCTDIQMLGPIAKPDPGRLMNVVNTLRPIGKTPLGQSVLNAAKQLNFTEEKATVILVSDGKENCGVDPCQLGTHLKRQGIDFKAHVIGFNLRRGEDAGLRCLARNTGGLYVEARNATSLQKALTVAVAQTTKPAPKPKPKPVALTGYKVRAFVKPDGPEWTGHLGIKLFGPPQGLDGKRKQVANMWRKKSGYIFKGVKPGKYLMRVTLPDHRHIVWSREVEIKAAGQTQNVVLNIGQVRFDYALSEGGKPFTWQVGWGVFEPKADFQGKRKRIANFWRKKSGNVFWLPAGKWLINGVLADARYMKVSKSIEVAAGGADRHVFNFNGGLVRFDAKLSEEGAPFKGQLGWKVFGKPKGLEGKRPVIANFWRKKSGNIFVLPTGEWDLFGELADHRYTTLRTKIKIAPGSEELHVFNFKAGVIRFDVTVEGKPSSDQIGLQVFTGKPDLNGKRKRIANFWRKRSGHIAILPQGDYQLSTLLADVKTVTGTQSLSVTAGDEKPVTLNLTKK